MKLYHVEDEIGFLVTVMAGSETEAARNARRECKATGVRVEGAVIVKNYLEVFWVRKLKERDTVGF